MKVLKVKLICTVCFNMYEHFTRYPTAAKKRKKYCPDCYYKRKLRLHNKRAKQKLEKSRT